MRRNAVRSIGVEACLFDQKELEQLYAVFKVCRHAAVLFRMNPFVWMFLFYGVIVLQHFEYTSCHNESCDSIFLGKRNDVLQPCKSSGKIYMKENPDTTTPGYNVTHDEENNSEAQTTDVTM